MKNDNPLDLRNLRGPLPLTDSDFTRIRANVMARVREPRRSVFALRFAFALVALVFAGTLLWQSLVTSEERTGTTPVAAVASPDPLVPASAPVAASSHSIAEPVVVVKAAARPAGPRRAPAAAPPIVAAETAPELRLELQTSDPDVRIIWIANQTYDSQPITVEESS